MANAYILNQLPVGYGHALSLLAEMLVAAGWNIKSSGDGLSAYSATGKVFTITTGGAGGWGNARAWVRLSDPANVRELVLQHNASQGLRVKYSAIAKFSGGTPSANTTPSAADEKYVIGGGTDAAPAYHTTYYSTGVATGIDRFHGAALSTPINGVYPFWISAIRTPTGINGFSAFMCDPTTGVPEDPDPCVWYFCHSATDAFEMDSYGVTAGTAPPNPGTSGVFGFLNVAKTALVYIEPMAPAQHNSNGGTSSGSIKHVRGVGGAPNPFNGKDDCLPILYFRPADLTAPVGLKGWGNLTRWTTMARNTVLDTLNDRQWICIGNVWLPWDGVTPPVN